MKITVKIILLIITLLLSTVNYLFSQSITGKVVDQGNGDGLAFANVVALSILDSAFVAGTVTRENGSFSLPLQKGNHLIRISYLGYEAWTGKVTGSDLGMIYLHPAAENLSEVVVTGEKKVFKLENGGITADIQNSPLKNMGTLPEVLGQLPFVLKDQDSYTVFGKGSPIFYINNRLVRNQFELRQINSKDIKKVIVITNPGAEYDASVNAVIKIETIRPVGEGLSCEIFSYNKYNKDWYTIDIISFNYRKDKLDIFGNLQYYNMSFPKDRIINYQIQTKKGFTNIISKTKDDDKWKFWTPQLGFNYQINKDHSLGAKYEYSNTFDLSGNYDVNTTVLKNGDLEESLHSDKKNKTKDYNHYVNAYYNGTWSQWITAKLDLDYKTTDRDNHSNVLNTLENQQKEDIITAEESSSDLYAGKLTFNTTIWDGNLTYGTEASRTLNRQEAFVYEDAGIPGILPSNNQVKQNLIAGFVSYGKTLGRFSGDIGFRFEDVRSKYYQQEELMDEQSKNYRNFFPNIRLSYSNDDIQMELAYRNSVSRPNYQDLRSSIYYQAPYCYFSGNPFLQPTYKNSLTSMLMWRNLTWMLTYSFYKDRIIFLNQKYMENSILLKPVNLDKSQQLNISLNYSKTFGVWKPNLEISMTKDFIEFGTPVIQYNKPIYYANFRNGFQLKGWQVGVDFRGRTKGHRDAEYMKNPSWQTNVYLNKSFFNETFTINVSGNDIFNTVDDQWAYISNEVTTDWDNRMYRRNIVLMVTYRFNATRGRYKGSQSTDELNRL